MGCSNTKSTNVNTADVKSSLLNQLFNSAAIKEMSRNALASVLKKYPESKRVFGVPETATSGTTDLTNVKEVKVASDKLLDHYVDIGKSTGRNFDDTIRKKADELNHQGVKAEYIKSYGENLAQNVTKDTNNKLSTEEENLWKKMTNEITNKLTVSMNKLPSIKS